MQRLVRASSVESGRPVPPAIIVSDTDATEYVSQRQASNSVRLIPFREARIPELQGLGPIAEIYNARARAQEVENARRADFPPPPESRDLKSYLGSLADWAKSFGRPQKLEDKGVWLCSSCRVYLDTLNPSENDKTNVDQLHQRLGIFPPFKRVAGINMALRKCARCNANTFSTLFAYPEAE